MGTEKEDRWKGRVSEKSRVGSLEMLSMPLTPSFENVNNNINNHGNGSMDVGSGAGLGNGMKKTHRRELSASSKMAASLGSGSLAACHNTNPLTSTSNESHFAFPTRGGSRQPIAEQDEEETMQDHRRAGSGDDFEMEKDGDMPNVKKGLGSVLRLSTSLQRSSKNGVNGGTGLMMSGITTGKLHWTSRAPRMPADVVS